MNAAVLGIHHVTAIAGSPQRNLDFYAGVLGLRFVKRTVNFDDPETYHFYYGDGEGHPGTLITFFPWSNAPAGRVGTRQVGVTTYSVAPEALPFWEQRLTERGVPFRQLERRFSEAGIEFTDPDGLLIEIVAHPTADPARAWSQGPVAPEVAIRGFHAVTLWAERLEPTARVLGDVLGFRSADQSDERVRFATGEGGSGTFVDVRVAPSVPQGVMGVGTVHHVAFRVSDAAAQLAVRAEVEAAGLHPTPVVDRQYFQSVYFHEPGGVLFEIATDPPGFGIDEPFESLGERLMLPPQYERYRAGLERSLPAITVPGERPRVP